MYQALKMRAWRGALLGLGLLLGPGLFPETGQGWALAAKKAKTVKTELYDAPLGPFPSLDEYCAERRRQQDSKLKGVKLENAPAAPYCKLAGHEIEGVTILKNPKAPFLAARISICSVGSREAGK